MIHNGLILIGFVAAATVAVLRGGHRSKNIVTVRDDALEKKLLCSSRSAGSSCRSCSDSAPLAGQARPAAARRLAAARSLGAPSSEAAFDSKLTRRRVPRVPIPSRSVHEPMRALSRRLEQPPTMSVPPRSSSSSWAATAAADRDAAPRRDPLSPRFVDVPAGRDHHRRSRDRPHAPQHPGGTGRRRGPLDAVFPILGLLLVMSASSTRCPAAAETRMTIAVASPARRRRHRRERNEAAGRPPARSC